MEKISIIIPIYNAELFLDRCLESVASQTYSNIEVLCVDDGSTDNSRGICEKFAKRDSRFKVFSKVNGGESSARNTGLRNATGKYIGFIDNDDWVEPDMYEILYKTALDFDVPISVVNFFRNTQTEQTKMVNINTIPDGVISPKDMMIYALNRDNYRGYCSYIWNKLFNADLIQKNNLLFDESLKFGGDVLFHAQVVLSDGCKGVYNEKPLYHYFQRESSTAHKRDISIKMDILKAYKHIEALLIKKGHLDISFWAGGFYCYHAIRTAELAIEQKNTDVLSLMKREIQLYTDDYIKTNENFPEKHEQLYNLIRG